MAMNKKGIVLRDMAVIVVLISMTALASGMFLVDFNSYYPSSTLNTSFVDTYNKSTEAYSTASQLQDTVNGSSISETGYLGPVLSGGWAAIKLAFSSVGLTTSIIDDASAELGLPNWFAIGISTIIVITIIFVIISAIFQRRI